MRKYILLRKNTPVTYALKKNDAIAYYPGSRDIYYKDLDITEFIGEELANIQGVRAVHYFPLCLGRKNSYLVDSPKFDIRSVKIGSFDLKDENVIYKTAPELSFYYEKDGFLQLLDRCPSDQNREQFIDENLKMFALDIYMCQMDRGSNIFYEFHPNGDIHLSPCFDYEWALFKNHALEELYTSDFFQFESLDDYHDLMIRLPQFKDYLKKYLDISLERVVSDMFKKRKFNLQAIDMDFYKDFDEATHKRLEKILK